jgi:hypothetical protein
MLFDRGKLQCRFEDFQNREDFRSATRNLQAALAALMLQQECSTLV